MPPAAKVFISYRRKPSAMLATLIAKELESRGIEVFVDTRKGDGTGPFPRHLLTAVENSDVFVCLLADSTFDSDWVRREIDHAFTMGKTMIPVFQESYRPFPQTPETSIEMLLMSQGVHVLDEQNIYIDEAIHQLAVMIEQSVPGPAGPPGEMTVISSPTSPMRPQPSRTRWLWLLSAIIILLIGFGVFYYLNGLPPGGGQGALTQTAIALAGGVTDTPTETPAPSATPSTRTPANTRTPTPTEIAIPCELCDIFPQGVGGQVFLFQDGTASLIVAMTAECARSGLSGLQLEYVIPEGGFGGWGVHWENSADGSFNASSFTVLVFWVKGSTGSDGFEVGLKDSGGLETKVGSVVYVVVSGSEWNKATLPLSTFAGVDMSSISNLNFGFNENHGSGKICIDDIAFEP